MAKFESCQEVRFVTANFVYQARCVGGECNGDWEKTGTTESRQWFCSSRYSRPEDAVAELRRTINSLCQHHLSIPSTFGGGLPSRYVYANLENECNPIGEPVTRKIPFFESLPVSKENLLIVAGVLVATGVLSYLFRRPIGKWIATLRRPAAPSLPIRHAPIPVVSGIQPTTKPLLVEIDDKICVEVRKAGDLLSDSALRNVNRMGQVKYMVAELPDGSMRMRVGHDQHWGMLNFDVGEKVVGAGFYRLDPTRRIFVIDGNSKSWNTARDSIVTNGMSEKRLVADKCGLNRVKEFLTTLFGDEIREITI